MSGTIFDLVPEAPEDPQRAELEIMRDMLRASLAMHGEYFCERCGAHGDQQERIEACRESPCGFRHEDGTLDAPYQARPDLERTIAEVEDTLAALARGELRRCRACGCCDLAACDPPCWWVAADLCSACQYSEPDEPD